MPLFSERHGLQPHDPEISVTGDAPEELRGIVVDIAYECGLDPFAMRSLVCRLLRKREDANNWSAFPNVDYEVRGHIDSCAWYEVYDVIEAVFQRLSRVPRPFLPADDYVSEQQRFSSEMNSYFVKRGIGWQLVQGHVQYRGSDSVEAVLRGARTALADSGLRTSAKELEEAIRDLSRKPEADLTGAIQHSLAALECATREACGEPQPTLGALLGKYPDLFPKPLNLAAEKLWAFASEQGRHLREGRVPPVPEAQLSVALSAALCTYIAARLKPKADV